MLMKRPRHVEYNFANEILTEIKPIYKEHLKILEKFLYVQ